MAGNGKLIEASNTVKYIKELGLSAKKRYGQNFLIDAGVLNRIIEGSEISREDVVLEIGPGLGTLTEALCESAGQVIAVEIDRDLIAPLEKRLAVYDNVRIINEDILRVNINELSAECGRPVKIVANLPYYITTPIITTLLESEADIDSITVMVQKEVAERMNAAPGGKDYGALTLLVDYYCETEILAKAPPHCFIPQPGVESAVIRLRLLEEPGAAPKDKSHMFRLIKAAFAQRRKTIQNSLMSDPSLGLSKEAVKNALEAMGLDERIRGERLSLQQFAELSDRLISG